MAHRVSHISVMKFTSGTNQDHLSLIAENPLAWIVSHADGAFGATPLPLIAETDAEGRLVSLLGHCSRRNVQIDSIRRNPGAVALFMGAQGYVSSTLVSRPGWIPTWQYAAMVVAIEISFVEPETLHSVKTLTDAMEKRNGTRWSLDRAGDRVETLLPNIIAFRGKVTNVDGRFNLGQQESVQELSDIFAGLADPDHKRWIKRMNAGRIADRFERGSMS